MPELSLQKKAHRLRIYINEKDRWHGKSLDEAILEILKEKGIAGATVFRGMAGYGANAVIHTIRIEVLSSELPLVIETIDTPEKIAGVLDTIYPMVHEGMITIEDVEIVKYSHLSINPLPADKPVSEVMTRDVITLEPVMSVHLAWRKMLENQVKAMPVTDPAGKVVGIVTDEDLLERAGVQQRLSIAIRMKAEEINQELHALEQLPLKVQDVMSRPVVTIFEGESLNAATTSMVKSGLKRLPVVDKEGKLSGMISRLDILRQVASVSYHEPAILKLTGLEITVKEVMSAHIPMVNQDDVLSIIIEKFSQANTHRLIVADSDGKVVGLISDSDVVTRVQTTRRRGILDALRNIGKPPAGKETAFDLMSPGALCVPPDTPIVDALRIMLRDARKWMVVVDEQNRPLGLVDRQIMLQAVSAHEGKGPR